MIYYVESHGIMPKHVQGHDTSKIKLNNRSAGFIIPVNNQSELKDLLTRTRNAHVQ